MKIKHYVEATRKMAPYLREPFGEALKEIGKLSALQGMIFGPLVGLAICIGSAPPVEYNVWKVRKDRESVTAEWRYRSDTISTMGLTDFDGDGMVDVKYKCSPARFGWSENLKPSEQDQKTFDKVTGR